MTNEELLQIIEQAARDKVTKLDLSYKGLTILPPKFVQLTNLLKDMNTLTPDIHSKSDFEELLNAIAQRLDE
ncbi:hypothetical protein [Nostoc sp. 'Peltigera membranacea cyanobiont' N6]|uniref:hypothetical protein n=1 Tax=Nostoc sp. 'Peltigera membranacea cyanobiont' N6 TaxID=1261031 RepID=UPI0015E49220|nr:hypothetical protein [Nostoc sp. 'Peltigera membranacea cyanobiont' N6]